MRIAFALVLISTGCVSQPLPAIGHSLEAVKEAWMALCQPLPIEAKAAAACTASHDELNKAIDVYSALNESVGE